MIVPEYGLGALYDFEEMEAIALALQQDSYEGGWILREFEKEFCEYTGAKHAVGTVSGTTALHMATEALDIGRGDEVVCTPQTFQATMLPFLARQVTVRFGDIEPETLCIDPATIEAQITAKTKAIYVMHYGGLPCDMDPIMKIARRHKLPVVEDAAHASGAEYNGRKIGSIADVTCFSFGSLKNMTTLGRGGMITTGDGKYAERLRDMRGRGFGGRRVKRRTNRIGRYAQPEPTYSDHSGDAYTHDWPEVNYVGMNIPMTGAEAAVGRVQLRKLDRMNGMRRELARRYSEGLTQIEGVRVQPVSPERLSIYHLYPFFISQSETGVNHDDLIRGLEARGVRINNRFFPCHLTGYMRAQGHRFGECPVVERVWFEEQVNLPISPLHKPEQMDYAVEQAAALVTELREAGARARLRGTASGRRSARPTRRAGAKKTRAEQ
ncbi:MAG: DegT/DnrJ/EryC1/StrS family aminotransferase [Armatimonadota bacterium]|nr:MAG: DegT/DnrJ/EryC1/StrS family aminotransferase [Armatimonadota bacterium]